MNRYKIPIILTLMLFCSVSFLVYLFSPKKELALREYEETTEIYLVDLKARLEVAGWDSKVSIESLKEKLIMIDEMREDGLINISNELYYLPGECNSNVCFSIREQFLFNFNF